MRADTIRVYSAKKGSGCGATERLEAEGNVYYVTTGRAARADTAVYTASGDTITLTGNVIIVQDKNVAHGDKLVLNIKTGEADMSSNATGRNNQNRVRGVFFPSGAGQ
jgi:lipopolysaccharide export system protein LptA